MIKYIILCINLLALNGCIYKVQRGYVPDIKFKENSSYIKPQDSTRNDVIFMLGEPSFMAFGNKSIFYASESGFRLASIGDIIHSSTILRYDFDNSDRLIEVKKYSLQNRKFAFKKKIKIKISKPNTFFSLPFYKLI